MSFAPAFGAALALLLSPGLAGAQTETTPAAAAAGQLTKAPELLSFVEATYPPEAFAARRAAEVTLALTIEANGVVSAVEVKASAGLDFDAAAVSAAQRFKFSAAEIDGVPAAVQILYRYAFTLETQVEQVEATPEHPTGALAGQLLERGTRKPLAGLIVRLIKVVGSADTQETYTDATGHFRFDGVPVGDATFEVEDAEYEAVEDTETVIAGQVTDVRLYVERTGFGDGMTVVARRPKKEVARRTLTIQEIRTIPGTNGDALKIVQSMPGAARIPFNGAGLVLRGGGETRAYVDGLLIANAFHFGGLRSVIDSALIESIDIYPGNFSPEYGHVTGGVVDVRLRDPQDEWHGYAQMDLFDASLFVEGPVTEHSSFAISGRRSYIDAVMQAALPDDVLENFSVAPRYYDYSAMYTYVHGPHHVRTMVLGADDKMLMLIDEPREERPSIRGDLELGTRFITTRTLWDYQVSDDVSHHLALSHLYSSEYFSLGEDFKLDIDWHLISLRDHVQAQLTDDLKVRGGVHAQLLVAKWDISAPRPPKEGDSGPPSLEPDDMIHSIDESVDLLPAVWAEVEWTVGKLTLLPGVRAEYFKEMDAFAAMPRLTARYKVAKHTVLKGAVGLYMQAPQYEETDKDFGNPDLDLERSVHYSAGFEQGLGEHLTMDIVGFYKTLNDLVASVDDPTVQYENDGEGWAYGMEALIKYEGHPRLHGWLAYTLMRSERRDAPGEAVRPFDLDQTHNLTLVAQYKLSTTWEIGARWRYVTGNPNTPVTGYTYDSDADANMPSFGAPNADRMAAFHQLDVRVDKHFVFDTWRLTTYLDLQNAYNQENPEGVRYNYDFTESEHVNGLPIIPSFGVRGEF